MTLIFCTDNKNGMAFHGRRQSRDRLLQSRLLSRTSGALLWMSPYSAKLFAPEAMDRIRVSEHFLHQAGENDFCFAETVDPGTVSPLPEQIIRYGWNRDYPADLHCTLDLSQYKQIHQEEFPGSSHERITEEVYIL